MHGVAGGGVKDWFTIGGEDKPLGFCKITFPVYRALVGTGECPEVCAFFLSFSLQAGLVSNFIKGSC